MAELMKNKIRIYILRVFLLTLFGCSAFCQTNGQTTHEDKKQKKVDKQQRHLNEHRERLKKKESTLDSKERVVRRNEKRLNADQKVIDKERPVNAPVK